MEVLKVESSGARIEKVQPIQFWLSVCFVSWDNARLTFYLCEKFCRKTLHLILPIQKCTSSFIVLPFSSANAFINVNFMRLKSKHLHVPFSTLVSSSRQAIDFRSESGGLFSNMFWRDRFCNARFVRVRASTTSLSRYYKCLQRHLWGEFWIWYQFEFINIVLLKFYIKFKCFRP